VAYAMIFIPGSGILAAYIDPTTGHLFPSFGQAVAIFLWAWFILSVAFTVGAIRSSWVLLADFIGVDLLLMLLACGYMTGHDGVRKAGYAVGYVVVFLSCK
jgi:uncharacterized protein